MTDAELDRVLLNVQQLVPPAVFDLLADELGRLRAMQWRARTVVDFDKDTPQDIRDVVTYILGDPQ